MSLTMHLYDEEICGGHYCPKDCEAHCPYADKVMEKQEREEEMKIILRDLLDCRNELCLRCGSYKTAHLGSCNGCRWKGGVWDL